MKPAFYVRGAQNRKIGHCISKIRQLRLQSFLFHYRSAHHPLAGAGRTDHVDIWKSALCNAYIVTYKVEKGPSLLRESDISKKSPFAYTQAIGFPDRYAKGGKERDGKEKPCEEGIMCEPILTDFPTMQPLVFRIAKSHCPSIWNHKRMESHYDWHIYRKDAKSRCAQWEEEKENRTRNEQKAESGGWKTRR